MRKGGYAVFLLGLFFVRVPIPGDLGETWASQQDFATDS